MTTTDDQPAYFELPAEVLDKAKGITLLDLLDCPATQCWTVSMMSNAASYSPAYADNVEPEDTLLLFQLNNVFQSINPATRHRLYEQIRKFRHSQRHE